MLYAIQNYSSIFGMMLLYFSGKLGVRIKTEYTVRIAHDLEDYKGSNNENVFLAVVNYTIFLIRQQFTTTVSEY